VTPEHKQPGYLTPSQLLAPLAEYSPDEVAKITAVVREADQDFERVGGSSRHWVRECLLPRLEAAGLRIVKATP
jgi:hypothetical protein